jgi:reactive intermediate/imine deaminase
MRHAVTPRNAPPALGPYSRGVVHDGLLWCSGALGLDAEGRLVPGSTADQARQALTNLEAVCAAAGTSLAKALRCTVYLTDLADFDEVNAVYAQAFTAPYPARTTIQVAALPKGGRVEIDAVVAVESL